MFPFDLPGPSFLKFYALFALAVIVAVYFTRRLYESGPTPQIDATDPYLFACLRDGPKEVVRVVTLGLVDRGQLEMSDRNVKWGPQARIDPQRPRIEQAVMRYFEPAADVSSIMEDRSVLSVAAADYEEELRRHQLVPDQTMQHSRRVLMGIAAALLAGVAGVKLAVALSAGRSNVLFLIVMTVLALYLAWRSLNPYRTPAGNEFLASIRSMFAGLRRRRSSLRAGSGSREVLWLTALFGVASLPATAFPFVHDFRERAASAGGGGDGSCSSGGGGGAGCGGGGGGCGGCGG